MDAPDLPPAASGDPLTAQASAGGRKRSTGMVVGVAFLVVGLILVVVAVLASRRGSDEGASGPTTTASPVVAPDIDGGTTAPLDGGALGEGTVPERDGRSPLQGFGEVAVTITSTDGEVCELCLLSAVSAEQRQRGLMEVTDEELGGYDGMLFEFPEPSAGAFWMRNTPMPLSIAYFDAQGQLVSTADMAPCDDSSSCPNYPAGEPFQYALEVPQGMLDEAGVDAAATLRIDARQCPLAGVEG